MKKNIAYTKITTKKEIRRIKIEIDPNSMYHESVGIGSLIDLIQERSAGEDTGIRVLEIE